MTRVKICGIRQLDHALVAAEAGADFIGLVFVPGRRRRVEVAEAQAISTGLRGHGDKVPKVVGLFADQPLEEVNRIVGACRLDLVQLCGRESLEYCQRVHTDVIKVLHVPGFAESAGPEIVEGSLPADSPRENIIGDLGETIHAYVNAGHLVTLDRLVEGLPGGTGLGFNREIAARLSQQGHSFLLAGGLTADNVAKAVKTVQPWGVDVSSGVETAGVKDPDKIREFISQVRLAKLKAP